MPGPVGCPSGTFYSSFIAQGNKCLSVQTFKAALPLKELPFSAGCMECTQPIWLFVGKNSGVSDLHGRNEHVDAVTHDGTWHVQSSGSKVWYVRPVDTPEWGTDPESRLVISDGSSDDVANITEEESDEEGKDCSENIPRLRVECNPGDVLVINTRVWWHQTHIPPTTYGAHEGDDGLSISYARDFFSPSMRLRSHHSTHSDDTKGGSRDARAAQQVRDNVTDDDDTQAGEEEQEQEQEEEEEYTNLEGLYASKNVQSGDIVLMEDEMPDCSVSDYKQIRTLYCMYNHGIYIYIYFVTHTL